MAFLLSEIDATIMYFVSDRMIGVRGHSFDAAAASDSSSDCESGDSTPTLALAPFPPSFTAKDFKAANFHELCGLVGEAKAAVRSLLRLKQVCKALSTNPYVIGDTVEDFCGMFLCLADLFPPALHNEFLMANLAPRMFGYFKPNSAIRSDYAKELLPLLFKPARLVPEHFGLCSLGYGEVYAAHNAVLPLDGMQLIDPQNLDCKLMFTQFEMWILRHLADHKVPAPIFIRRDCPNCIPRFYVRTTAAATLGVARDSDAHTRLNNYMAYMALPERHDRFWSAFHRRLEYYLDRSEIEW